MAGYTLLDLQWLDARRVFGTTDGMGLKPNRGCAAARRIIGDAVGGAGAALCGRTGGACGRSGPPGGIALGDSTQAIVQNHCLPDA